MIAAPGISAVAYALASESHTIRDLAMSGALESEPALLERFGIGSVRIAAQETPYELALEAASALISEREIDPASIDALIYCGAPSAISFSTPAQAADDARGQCDTRRFRYPGTRLQFELGLVRASVVGLDQLVCTAILSAVRLAGALCIAEGLERVLCVSSDFYPSGAGREAITNCTSDASCAVLVERNATRNRIMGSASVTNDAEGEEGGPCEARVHDEPRSECEKWASLQGPTGLGRAPSADHRRKPAEMT